MRDIGLRLWKNRIMFFSQRIKFLLGIGRALVMSYLISLLKRRSWSAKEGEGLV